MPRLHIIGSCIVPDLISFRPQPFCQLAACQDEIEVEKHKVLDAARASAREEGRQLIENAQKEADKVIRKAGEDARREKDKMLEQAKHEILSLVLDAAAGSMNKKSDDSALYDEFLKKAGTTENEET